MSAPVTMSRETAARFVRAVEGMFQDDPNWSVLDLDGAREFYAAAGIEPDPDAVKVDCEACPECGETGYSDPLQCSFCADPGHRYDFDRAESEGWFISQNGDGWRLERRDENPVFDGDPEAHAFVVREAYTGAAHARDALRWLRTHAPEEFATVLNNADPDHVARLYL